MEIIFASLQLYLYIFLNCNTLFHVGIRWVFKSYAQRIFCQGTRFNKGILLPANLTPPVKFAKTMYYYKLCQYYFIRINKPHRKEHWFVLFARIKLFVVRIEYLFSNLETKFFFIFLSFIYLALFKFNQKLKLN